MSKYNKFYLISLICCVVVLAAVLVMRLVSQDPRVVEIARYLLGIENGYYISLILSRMFKEKEKHDNTYM